MPDGSIPRSKNTGHAGAPQVTTGPVARGRGAPPASTPAAAPNTTAAELRAIRRELEIVREQQTKILQLLERRGAETAPVE